MPPEMVQKCLEFLPFDKLIERGAWAWEAHDVTAPLWSEGWENRAKARVFCAEIARIREVLAERHAALLNGEYDSESESDDSDSEPQYDDDDPRAY